MSSRVDRRRAVFLSNLRESGAVTYRRLLRAVIPLTNNFSSKIFVLILSHSMSRELIFFARAHKVPASEVQHRAHENAVGQPKLKKKKK